MQVNEVLRSSSLTADLNGLTVTVQNMHKSLETSIPGGFWDILILQTPILANWLQSPLKTCLKCVILALKGSI